jgi:hypothetical protein
VQRASFEKFQAQHHADVATFQMRHVADVHLKEVGTMKQLRIASLESGSL